MENKDQPLVKDLIGPLLPCSESVLFDGQSDCPRPAVGNIEMFESPAPTSPPQGDLSALSQNS